MGQQNNPRRKLVLGLLVTAFVLVAGVTILGGSLDSLFTDVADTVSSATQESSPPEPPSSPPSPPPPVEGVAVPEAWREREPESGLTSLELDKLLNHKKSLDVSRLYTGPGRVLPSPWWPFYSGDDEWFPAPFSDCEPNDEYVSTEALTALLKRHQERMRAEPNAVGCLVAPHEDSYSGTAWLLSETSPGSESRLIVTARHVIVGEEKTFIGSPLEKEDVEGFSFQLPCALERGDKVAEYEVVNVVFDGRANGADLDLVVLEVQGETPLPEGLRVSEGLPLLHANDESWRRWVAVPGYPLASEIRKERAKDTWSGEVMRCLPREMFDTLVQGFGYVTDPDEAGLPDWPFFLHTADTLAGVSGAPVIDLASGLVIGVHTHSAAALARKNAGRHNKRLRNLTTVDRNLAFTTSALCDLPQITCVSYP